ncbi:MAG: hypothetical protein PHV36_11535 [Elusimicrobiales bacterium]|nr:hypothetical protein [Elusimicrobiales bacterium]
MKSRIQKEISNAALAALFTILIFAANSARAAVPELINFQGKLTDSAGTAITVSVPMVFKFYTTATGGSLVWSENQDVVPDSTGLYSVLLGSATSFSTYGISFSTSYWLGVTVGTDLEMTPRYKIVSSAYALYSINSGTAAYSVNSGTSAWANGVDWPMVNHKPVFGAGDVYLASTQTFTGNNSFQGATYLSSATYVTGGGIYSTGAVGGVPFSGSGARFMWIPEKYALRAGKVTGAQWDAGNIGDFSTAFGDSNTASYFYDTVAGGRNNTASGGASNVAGGTDNNVTALYANIAGGTGNTASNEKASVTGGARNKATGFYSTVTGGDSNAANGDWSIAAGGIGNTANNDYSFAAGYRSSSTADGAFTWSDSEGALVNNNVADRTWFKNRGGFLITNTTNAGGAAFSVDSSGYVAVGTMLVPSTFTVVGTFKLIDGSAAAGRVLTSDANGLARWAVAGGGGGDVYKASTQTFTGSNTFISTTAFTALDPSLPGVTISSGLIVSAGNVGIGTTVPTSTLTVVGTFKLVDGTQTNGYVLTSNAAGLANWQAPVTGGDVYKASTQTFTGENSFTRATYFSSSAYFTNGGIYSTGTTGGVAFSGAGTRLMWIPEKGALRAGIVAGASWDSNNIGLGSIAFGNNSTSSNTYTTVSGGNSNSAGGYVATVGGGQSNIATGDWATAAGGQSNTASGIWTTVTGGQSNTASSLSATVSGGQTNTATGSFSTVGGGKANAASNSYSAVAGGWGNTASGQMSVVAGGADNIASSNYTAVAGGFTNTASANYATVSGGRQNVSSMDAATVSGGYINTAIGLYSTVAGGLENTAKGNNSFAAGYKSSSTANGTFTWSDSAAVVVENNVVDRTWFKNRGGFLATASTNTADGGMFLNNSNYVGIGTLVPTSTLTVIGTFKLADGSQGAGKVLTSDAVGLAAWAAPAGPVYAVTQANNINATPTLADIPMLSVALLANATYQFEAELSCGAGATAVGLQYAVAYPAAGATVEAVIYGPVSSAAMMNSRITAINTATQNYLTEIVLTGGILIKGIITTSSSGNLTIQHAAPNPNNSTVYKGSYLKVTKL